MLILLAQTNTSTAIPEPWGTILNLGVVAVVLIALLMKQLVPGWVYKELQARNAFLEKEVQDLNRSAREEVVPALLTSVEAQRTSSTAVSEAAQALMLELEKQRDRERYNRDK